ncbi:hypothetical protein [Pseudalkalibacillus caeni]|uniref:DUF4230 domain-containing protein n=1 Tax=Exobacillus caeni TaxID=2574798 RepID=A0A5R9EZK0_9BACL|nr:hypothetical protein [Pseudalkalibacillus caeni]TLS36762.1 hypothetical protein FCL54_12425 [Pseudalkalibacillus caeni]
MKIKISTVLTLILFSIAATAVSLQLIQYSKDDLDTVYAVSGDSEDDIKVGKIAIEKIHEEANLTSNTYEASYPIEIGTMDKDNSFWDKVKHQIGGKSVKMDAFVFYDLRSDLLKVTENDVSYDPKTKTLSIAIPDPELNVRLNTSKTETNSFKGLFSTGYSDESRMRHLDFAVKIAKKEISKDNEKIDQAKNDIKDSFSDLLSMIDTVEHVYITFK